MVTLRPMTDAEYEPYLRRVRETYARDRAESSRTSLEEELAEADRQIAQLLPNGLGTPNQHLWTVVDAVGAPVGILWVYVDRDHQRGFIYDIEMREDQRGKGYGRATLEALEAELRPRDVTRIALNVFARNAVARHLYDQVGYYPVATVMQKDI